MNGDIEVIDDMRIDVYLGMLGEGGGNKCVQVVTSLPTVGKADTLYCLKGDDGYAKPYVWWENQYITCDKTIDLSSYATKTYVDGKDTALQTAINGKANTSHTHVVADITDFPNIPTVDEIVTKIYANNTYQLKGDYATKADLTPYQKKHDTDLETTAKDVVPAINEVMGLIQNFDLSGKQDKIDTNINVTNSSGTYVTNVVNAINQLNDDCIKKINVGAFSSIAFSGGARIGKATSNGCCRLYEWTATNGGKSYSTFEVAQVDGGSKAYYLTEFTIVTRSAYNNAKTSIMVHYFKSDDASLTFNDVIRVCMDGSNAITLFAYVYSDNSLYSFLKRKGPDWSVTNGYRLIPIIGTDVAPEFGGWADVTTAYGSTFIPSTKIY